MEQTRAINALAPFLALSKSANSPRAAADLVTQATSAQNTYVFAELLQTPPIQKLREDTQYGAYYRLLEVFAWGTWEEYQEAKGSLPSLSEPQCHKLRLLTLLTLAARCTSSSQLTYANLQRALSLATSTELEQLVTDAIYANLLTGTLNPAQQTVIISSVAPLRDLAPGSVAAMMSELEAWSQRCEGVLQDLEAEISKVKRDAAKRARKEAEHASQMERAEKAAEFAGGGGARGAGRPGRSISRYDSGDNLGDAMDVDGGGGGAGGAGQKRSKNFLGSRKR